MKFEIAEVVIAAVVFFVLGYGACALRVSQLREDNRAHAARETLISPMVHWPGNP